MRNRIQRTTLILLCIWAVTACQAVYETNQAASQQACEKLLNWEDRQRCLQQNNKPYDAYEKQRNATTDNKAQIEKQ